MTRHAVALAASATWRRHEGPRRRSRVFEHSDPADGPRSCRVEVDPTTERAVVVHRHVLRSLSTVAVAAMLAGCASQEPFGLPPLGSPVATKGTSTTMYYGYGTYPRYDHYPNHYYPYVYRSAYAEYPYRPDYHSYSRGPFCRDANRDGYCDVRRDPPEREEQDADVFGQLRDALDARAGAGPAKSAPAPTTLPGRTPPPPKVAPPNTSPAPAARVEPQPARRFEQPTRKRPPLIHTDEP